MRLKEIKNALVNYFKHRQKSPQKETFSYRFSDGMLVALPNLFASKEFFTNRSAKLKEIPNNGYEVSTEGMSLDDSVKLIDDMITFIDACLCEVIRGMDEQEKELQSQQGIDVRVSDPGEELKDYYFFGSVLRSQSGANESKRRDENTIPHWEKILSYCMMCYDSYMKDGHLNAHGFYRDLFPKTDKEVDNEY